MKYLIIVLLLSSCGPRQDWDRCIFDGKWQSFCEAPPFVV